MALETITRQFVGPLGKLAFAGPVACVYHPLDYAWDVHRQWLERYGHGRKEALFVGMNPGPFGMVQTGVPFGEVEAVRSFLGLRGDVKRPENEHPDRPVLGFACERSEISGKRLWGWAAHRFVTPGRFFRRFFVHNYCPLAFVADSGANLTPDKLPSKATQELYRLCDRLLAQTVEALRPSLVIGVGAFAEQQAKRVIGEGKGVRFGRIPHPSPASPLANRGWEPLVDAALSEMGVAI